MLLGPTSQLWGLLLVPLDRAWEQPFLARLFFFWGKSFIKEMGLVGFPLGGGGPWLGAILLLGDRCSQWFLVVLEEGCTCRWVPAHGHLRMSI